ncbi:MAG TPA: MarR family transcriptional regulator [Polyangiaceae bacterium]|nr:MarR family transcriptional regulator [Polyangiaceae bacterium]
MSFLQLLWAVTHGMESISKRMRRTVGVTGPQRLVIRLIGRGGRVAPGELAEILHVHPSSLTGVLRRLERAGLVRRTPDPGDGRRVILALTSRGQMLNDQDRGTVESAVKRMLRRAPAAHAAATREVLSAFASELAADTRPAVTTKRRTRSRARRVTARRAPRA